MKARYGKNKLQVDVDGKMYKVGELSIEEVGGPERASKQGILHCFEVLPMEEKKEAAPKPMAEKPKAAMKKPAKRAAKPRG